MRGFVYQMLLSPNVLIVADVLQMPLELFHVAQRRVVVRLKIPHYQIAMSQAMAAGFAKSLPATLMIVRLQISFLKSVILMTVY